MASELLLWACLALPASAAAPAKAPSRLFIGHYGTYVSTPDQLKVTGAQFAPDGIEVVIFTDASAAKSDPGYLLLIFPRTTRPRESSDSLVRDIFEEGAGRGLKREDFSREDLKEGRLLTQKKDPRMVFLVAEGPEYLYRVSGRDRSKVAKILAGLKQEPRASWDKQVIAARRKRDGAKAFIPDLSSPPVFKSGLGYSLSLPKDYAFRREAAGEGETLTLFPKVHGVLINQGILDSSVEWANFGVAQIQVRTRKKGGTGPKDTLLAIAALYKRRNGLKDEDFSVKAGPRGAWFMDRLRPDALRYAAWSDKARDYLAVSATPGLADSLVARVSR